MLRVGETELYKSHWRALHEEKSTVEASESTSNSGEASRLHWQAPIAVP